MTRKISLLTVIIMLFVIVLAGCEGSPSSATPPTSASAPASSVASTPDSGAAPAGGGEKRLLTIGTASQTGTSYAIGAAIATLLNNHMDDVQFSAQATAGGVQNIELLRSNELDFAVVSNEAALQSLNATGTFAGKEPANFLRTVTYIGTWTQHILTNDLSIDNIEDFKGKKFAVGGAGSGVEETFRGTMRALDINYAEDKYFSPEYMAIGNAGEALANGQIDGAYDNQILPAAAETTIMASGKAKLISYTEEQIEKIQKGQPYAVRSNIPANTYPNQDYEVISVGFNNHLMTRESIDEETVYRVCKTIFENIDELHEIYSNLSALTAETAMTTYMTPAHDGALRYYKEIGVAK